MRGLGSPVDWPDWFIRLNGVVGLSQGVLTTSACVVSFIDSGVSGVQR